MSRGFDEVKDEIRKQLAVSNASQEVINVHDQIEDLRGSGSTLEQIADQLKLKAVVVEAVDATGLDKNGNEVKDIPAKQQVLGAAFRTDAGADAPSLSIGTDGYLWFDVRDVTPERDRPLSEVKDKAVADWTAEQQKLELAKKAEELKQQAQKGTSLADIAAPLGITVESKTGITRGTDDAVLGRAGVAAAFSGPMDTVANAVGGDPTTQILLKVTEVNTEPTSDVLNNQDQQITATANAAGDDILDQMVNLLQTQYGASINQSLADQAASAKGEHKRMTDLKPLLAKAASREPLTREEAREAFDILMSGQATPSQIGGFLMALRVRGETVDEIVGAVTTMRSKMLTVDAPADAIDIVGTGGDAQRHLQYLDAGRPDRRRCRRTRGQAWQPGAQSSKSGCSR